MIVRLCCAVAFYSLPLLFLQPLKAEAEPAPGPVAAIAAIAQTAQTSQGDQGAQGGAEDVKSVSARKLAGYVHMAIQKDTAVAKVLVEEYDASWDRVLGSTTTDYHGHFALKPARGRKIHHLRLTAKGFSLGQYAVTLSPDAPPELMLELRLASNSQEDPARQPPGISFAGQTPAVHGMS